MGRLSPHPATLEATTTGENGRVIRRRVIPPSRAHRLLRARGCRLDACSSPRRRGFRHLVPESSGAVVLELLKQRGALFFPDMVRATGRLKAEIETGLWELVAAGLVTADGFENLRALVTPRWRTERPNRAALPAKESPPPAAPSRSRPLVAPPHRGCRSRPQRRILLLDAVAPLRRRLPRSARRETNLPRWRELQIGYRRLEDRARCAVDALSMAFRASSSRCPSQSNRCAPSASSRPCQRRAHRNRRADPLNLVGIVVPASASPPSPARASPSRRPLEAEDALQASGIDTATA